MVVSDVAQAEEAEGLTLLKADTKTGYFGVYHKSGQPKPDRVQVRRRWRGGKKVHLGIFATTEEAALYIARSPEGQAAAAERAAAPPQPRRSEEKGQGSAPPRGPAQCSSRRAQSHPCHPVPSSRRRASSRPCHPTRS